MSLNLDPVAAKAVETAVSLKIIDFITQTDCDVAELAEELSLSERGLRPLLYFLCSVGLLEQIGDRFRLLAVGKEFLETEWETQRARIVSSPDWEHLEDAVRTGRCVRPAIEGASDGGVFFSGIVDTLYRLHSGLADAVAAELPASLSPVLDLGAGSAVWSLHYAKRHPAVEVVAVDHANVLRQVTERFVREHSLASRYEMRAGSYHEVALEPDHFSLVYLGHVIHSEGPQASRALLTRCCHALKRGGTLVIAEWVGSQPRGLDYHANLFDLNMLMFTENGLVFTASEMEELCREAGLEIERWVKGPGQYPVLVAQKP